jgi:hypothetical protein
LYSYEVKVRGTTYLWGSLGIEVDLKWPLLLSVRNDLAGETVTILTETTSGQKTTIGMLEPGECHTFSLLGARGAVATCPKGSTVVCFVFAPHIGPAA